MRPLLAALALLTLTSTANAQFVPQDECLRPADVKEKLGSDYGEALAGRGITAGGWLAEVYQAETGTWTFVMYNPTDGCARMMFGGDNWTKVDPPLKGTAL